MGSIHPCQNIDVSFVSPWAWRFLHFLYGNELLDASNLWPGFINLCLEPLWDNIQPISHCSFHNIFLIRTHVGSPLFCHKVLRDLEESTPAVCYCWLNLRERCLTRVTQRFKSARSGSHAKCWFSQDALSQLLIGSDITIMFPEVFVLVFSFWPCTLFLAFKKPIGLVPTGAGHNTELLF